MFATSDLFDRRIRQSGIRKTVADLMYFGEIIYPDMPVTEGSLTFDADSAARSGGTITIGDPGLIPTFSNFLHPLGAEISIRTGIVYPNRIEEFVPMGIYNFEETSWDESSSKLPSVQLFDRTRRFERSEIEVPVSYAGWEADAVVEAVVNYISPGTIIDYDVGLDFYKFPGSNFYDSGNYWEIISNIAKQMDAWVYFDRTGQLVFRKKNYLTHDTSPSTAVWQLNCGEDGVLVEAGRSISAANIYNSITVYGAPSEAEGTPVGRYRNLDPDSPTRYDGPFGKRGKPITDTSLTHPEQCVARAKSEVQKLSRLSRAVNWSAIPNPAVDVNDIVLVTYVDASTELIQLDSITYPLSDGTFSGTGRSERIEVDA